jgi:hypothetical protein
VSFVPGRGSALGVTGAGGAGCAHAPSTTMATPTIPQAVSRSRMRAWWGLER